MRASFFALSKRAAWQLRTFATADWERIFTEVDVVATPTTATLAPRIADEALSDGTHTASLLELARSQLSRFVGESNLQMLLRLTRFTNIANFVGFPAVTFPVALHPAHCDCAPASESEGSCACASSSRSNAALPIGFQFLAAWWREALLLRLAHAAEHMDLAGIVDDGIIPPPSDFCKLI